MALADLRDDDGDWTEVSRPRTWAPKRKWVGRNNGGRVAAVQNESRQTESRTTNVAGAGSIANVRLSREALHRDR